MKYRIVLDAYAGFEAQFKPRFWPFWKQCCGCNTSPTLDAARRVCDAHSARVVEYYNRPITDASLNEDSVAGLVGDGVDLVD
jgi:hypothetical protein